MKIAKELLPPVAFRALLKFKSLIMKEDPNKLFDGNDRMFKDEVASSSVYFEYGCGKSTIWTTSNTKSLMFCVDTSKDWINFVDEKIKSDRLKTLWVDCGPIGKWGRPKSYQNRENFRRYADILWEQGVQPDIILVDGRFRVLCFLVSLRNAKVGTKIIFDDYINREHYHIVEEFVPREQVCGRQCLFVVPERTDLDLDALNRCIEKFEYVMD